MCDDVCAIDHESLLIRETTNCGLGCSSRVYLRIVYIVVPLLVLSIVRAGPTAYITNQQPQWLVGLWTSAFPRWRC